MAASSPFLVPTRPASRLFGKTTLWLIMGLLGISVIFSTEIPILRDRTGVNHDYFLKLIHDRYFFIPHAAGGLLAMFIGPLQFSSRLRRRYPRLHRYLGRIYVFGVFLAVPFAILISWGSALIVGTCVQAGLWFFCTLFALITARNRQIAQHRQWMVRSYAMTFTFITVRTLDFIPAYLTLPDATANLVIIVVSIASVFLCDIAFNWRELTTKRA